MIDGSRSTTPPDHPSVQYCTSCGEIVGLPARWCPRCGTALLAEEITGTRTLAMLLTELHGLAARGVLGERCYKALRTTYEQRLEQVRPAHAKPLAESSTPAALPARRPRYRGRASEPTAPAAVPKAERGGSRTVIPPSAVLPSTAPPGPTLGQWIAARQADILLYLGAFILSIAALILVGYQGAALGGPARFSILLAYTAAFLALGVYLPRWERVREAGLLFLALGAVLTPINVVALRTQVLGAGTLPDHVLVLAGATATALLYWALALRGFGRFYAVPGTVAALIGWGALAATLTLPIRWFGPWFVLAATMLSTLAAVRRPAISGWLECGAVLLATGGLLLAHAAAFGALETAHLPSAYALALFGTAVHVYARRSRAGKALLPPLTALTVITFCSSSFGLPVEWFPSFATIAGLGYLLLAHRDRSTRSRPWALAGACCAGLALYGTHVALKLGDVDRAVAPVVYALVLGGVVAAFLRWRWREALAAIPPLAAALGAAVSWWLWDVPAAAFGAYGAMAALGYVLLADLDCARRPVWRATAGATAVLALLWAHGGALGLESASMQLPITYALVFLGAVWESRRRRDAVMLALPALGAMFAATWLWAMGIAAYWWIYPGLAAVLVILGTEPYWRHRPVLRAAGWPYLLGATLLLTATFAPLHADRPAHGLLVSGIAALVFLAGTLFTRGSLTRLLIDPPGDRARGWEQQALEAISSALLYLAAAYLNAWAGLEGVATAWVYVGLGTAAWLGIAVAGRRRPDLYSMLAPEAVIALIIAVSITLGEPGITTLILALGTAGPALAFPATRRWLLWGVAAAFGTAAIAFAWQWQALRPADLPLLYGLLAALLWLALIRLRRYHTDERGRTITALSWCPWILTLSTASLLLIGRWIALDSGEALVRTREWAVLAITLAAAAVAVTYEGIRLRRPLITVSGTVGVLAAALLAIAITQPGNVQAYTLPVGLYFVLLGLRFRRSVVVLGPHMTAHEAAVVVGLLFLVLPPAEQSFGPDGARYGPEVIALGLISLAAGLALAARWLVAGGVASLTGVAVRWLLTSGAVPYWLTLGITGMLLLGAGILLLLQRERWDAARARLARWWLSESGTPDPQF